MKLLETLFSHQDSYSGFQETCVVSRIQDCQSFGPIFEEAFKHVDFLYL